MNIGVTLKVVVHEECVSIVVFISMLKISKVGCVGCDIFDFCNMMYLSHGWACKVVVLAKINSWGGI